MCDMIDGRIAILARVPSWIQQLSTSDKASLHLDSLAEYAFSKQFNLHLDIISNLEKDSFDFHQQ
jgi:hypothetical protein